MSIVRDVTLQAAKQLQNDDILLFIGCRQAGKTTILKQLKTLLEKEQETVCFLNLEDPDYLGLLNQSPKNIFKIFTMDLKKKVFLFVDEIQYLEDPSNFLKYLYDEYKGKIKLLVSGSSAFYLDKKFKDSLAGRKRIYFVPTLSFHEFLRFKGENTLAGKDLRRLSLSENEKASLHYREYLIYGGYPKVVLAGREEKEDHLREIAYAYIKKDIHEAHIRQEGLFYKLFKILAAQTGSLVNASELAATLGVSKTAVDHYLSIMQKSFHIHLVKPFFNNIRKELTKMPKAYFLDLGLRNFFAGDFRGFSQRQDRGLLLENAVFRQLSERYELDEIKFWRTIQQHEIDFVVGEREAFEVKTDPGKIKAKSYQPFIENYPDIPLSLVSLEAQQELSGAFKVAEAWQL